MAKLSCSMIISLDGYTEDAHWRFGWGGPEDTELPPVRTEDARDAGLMGDRAHARFPTSRCSPLGTMVFEIRGERIQTIQVIATRDKLGRCARGLGELAVIDCAGQHQSADDRGHGRERVFVDTRISLVGRMPGYFDAGWEFFTPSAFRP